MKIKINNIKENNKLFELEDPTKPQEEQSAYKVLEAEGEQLYILDRKKESLPINIIISKSLGNDIDVPSTPEDIGHIMASFLTNKARKTLNIGGMMVDPISTYNKAEDICNTQFGKFSAMTMTTDKTSIKHNKSHIVTDGVLFNQDNPLNEGEALGIAVGNTVGIIGAESLKFVIGATAMTTAHIAPILGAMCLGAYGAGYIGQLVAGDTVGTGVENDKQAAHLNVKGMMKPTAKMPMDYGNILDAIDQFTEKTLDAMKNVAMAISPSTAAKLDEVSDFATNFLITETKEAKKFLEANSELLRKQREQIASDQALLAKAQVADKQKVIEFLKYLIDAVISSGKTPANINNIVDYYDKHKDDKNGINMYDAAKAGKYDDVLKIFGLTKASASVFVDNTNINSINEGEANNTETTKPPYNIDKIYKRLKVELKSKISKAFNEVDTSKMAGLEDAKTLMKDMVTAADNEIKHKIEQICKSPTSQNYGKETGLGDAAIKFLAGHPIEAENLQGVWSRHLADLNMRMSNRIQQMTDINNTNRTLGWTKELCISVFPELLARMLAYRYGYAILSNEGIYNYDNAKLEQDKKNYANVKDLYINSVRTKLIWLLSHYSGDYTNNNQSIITKNGDGGYLLTSGTWLAYASFFIIKLGGLKNDIQLQQSIGAMANALANIDKAYNDENEKFEKLLDIAYANLDETYKNLLMDIDSNKQQKSAEDNEKDFNKVAEKFKLSDDFKEVKPIIDEAYNKIIEICKNVNEKLNDDTVAEQIGISFDILYNLKGEKQEEIKSGKSKGTIKTVNFGTIYKSYLDHKDEVNALITKCKENGFIEGFISGEVAEEAEESSIDEKTLKKMHQDILNIFGEDVFDGFSIPETNVYTETIKAAFADPGTVDKYAYILSWFGKDNMSKIEDNDGKIDKTHSPEGIKRVCAMVPNMLELVTSGVLILGLDLPKEKEEKEKSEDNIDNLFNSAKNIAYYLYDGNTVLNDNEVKPAQGSLEEAAYNAYKSIITNDYKQIVTNIITNYTNTIKGAKAILVNNPFEGESFEKTVEIFATNTELENIYNAFDTEQVNMGKETKVFKEIGKEELNTIINNICKSFNSVKNNIDELKKHIEMLVNLASAEITKSE